MLKTDLERKIFMAQSFLDVASLNENIGVLSIAANSQDEAIAKMDHAKLGKKFVTHFLYAMAFELSIKTIWEIEHGKGTSTPS